MKKYLDLAKANPVVVASIIVALLAIVALFVVVRPMGTEFVAEMDKRKTDANKIKSLMSSRLEVPDAKPDAPPKAITVVINKATNEALTKMYDTMRTQSETVFKTATEINQAFHVPMLDGLLPESSNDARRYDAKDEYIRQFKAMLGKPSIADADAPRLNASDHVPFEEVQDVEDKVTNKFLAGFFPRRTETELSIDDRKKLAVLRSEAVMKLMQDHARRTSIYATTDEKLDTFPFDIGAWARTGTLPQMRDIWEGQMDLWIQQDIVRAIALANKPNREKGSLHQSDTVLTAPIKHLLAIRVFDDYVGITGMGGMGRTGAPRPTGGPGGPGGPGGEFPMGPGGGGPGMDYFRSDTTNVILEELKNYNPDQRLPEMFNISMTGRVGNAIYDVRHVQVELIAEFRQLPKLFSAIGRTNFMTVLDTYITDEDEYAALADGYLYGENDCVRVQLLIETIWLREWTSQLMPKVVKGDLGIVEKPAATPTP